ncbi:MAG: glycosyl hydrolase family 2 [Prevotella sp.]|nr:glycosyl hydrolase family 2 [Prevotella sp.]
MRRSGLLIVFLTIVLSQVMAEDKVSSLTYGFLHPQDTARTKVWWFFGETPTTREGITADLEAFKQQGVGGVVYYDQVHGKGEGADELLSPKWWQDLIFASQEARRLGLSFEINVGNGYVAGGKWITPDKGMQRLAMVECLVEGGQQVSCRLPLPRRHRNWHQEVAVLAVPYSETLLGDSRILKAVRSGEADNQLVYDFGQLFTARSITYEVTPIGKARTSSMPVPKTHRPLDIADPHRFYGAGYRELPDIGVLEASADGEHYTKVCDLHPKYRSLGGVKQQTIAFPAVQGRYFRVSLNGKEKVSFGEVVISARACIDEWEEKACWMPEFIDDDKTPQYNKVETIHANQIIDLTTMMDADGTLHWQAPRGQWLVMRFVAVSTGGHTKHGREAHLGLECDKLSADAVRLHWQSYTKPVIDSIRAHGGVLEGVCMDSHEAGPQNWTATMPADFQRLRGYDMKTYLPAMVGMVVDDSRQSSRFLGDLRRTISDLITVNYFGEFNRLCHAEGLTLTAQAIGGALCFPGDNIEVKRMVDKPQGEFWGYQREGNYDIKDCSSAAHVYGKQIASGEAFTDISYKHTLAQVKSLADYAYCFGINEFVVCAVAYQPWVDGRGLNTANGRQYVLNRMNTQWPMSRGFWDYQTRTSWMLRQGKPVADLCLYLGDDVPKRILGHLLPDIPQGYDFDAFTTDVLLHRMRVEQGRLVLPDGITYGMMLLPRDEELTPAARQKVDELRRAGAHIWDPHSGVSLSDALRAAGMRPDVDMPSADRLYFCHRRTAIEDIYYLDNHSDETVSGPVVFNTRFRNAEWWNPVTGQRYAISPDRLTLSPRESCFIVFSDLPSTAPQLPVTVQSVQEVTGSWQVMFDAKTGGPEKSVTMEQLTDWSKYDNPLIRYYSGTATYTNTFSVKQKDAQAAYRLALSGVSAVAQVFVNGQEAGTVWCAPWTLDITPYIQKGTNRLEIQVANCLWNRLVGDANRPEGERLMRQTHPLAKPDDKLITSGLTGSVRLEVVK